MITIKEEPSIECFTMLSDPDRNEPDVEQPIIYNAVETFFWSAVAGMLVGFILVIAAAM